MSLGLAKTIKFLPFVAMLVLGATTVPQVLFLLFLQGDVPELPQGTVSDVIVNSIVFIIVVLGFFGVSSWVRKKVTLYSHKFATRYIKPFNFTGCAY